MRNLKNFLMIVVILSLATSACTAIQPEEITVIPGTPVILSKVTQTPSAVPTQEIPETVSETSIPASVPAAQQQVGDVLTGEQAYKTDPSLTDAQIEAWNKASNAFALDLYQELAKKTGNVFFSPYSIYSALAMTYAGAKNKTAAEMEKALHFPYSGSEIHELMNGISQRLKMDASLGEGEAVKLNIANALWGQLGYPVQAEFLDALCRNYEAGYHLVNYRQPAEAAKLINDWVARQTEEKIQGLISENALNANTRLILTNAIYFQGIWESQFKEKDSFDGSFYLEEGTSLPVKMMSQVASFSYIKNDKYQAVEMPYMGGNYSLMLVMPYTDTLAEFEKDLKPDFFDALAAEFKQDTVSLWVPKLEMDQSIGLKDVLSNLEMSTAFTAKADFSGITGSKDLKINDVVHKAYLKIDEKGTEAAAATGIVMGLTSARQPDDPIDLHFDHPFLLLIRDNALKTTLFMGRYAGPASN